MANSSAEPDFGGQVRAQDPGRLQGAFERNGWWGETRGDTLLVHGATPEQVGLVAHQEGVALFLLAPQTRSLEAAFFALTADQR